MTDAYTVVRLSPLRKLIAARMVEAKRTIPHFHLIAEIEMDALLKLRTEVNSDYPERRISINDCVIKACASALMMHPAVNIQFQGEEIHQYHQADISVIVAVEGGLSMPIVRAADRKSVHAIAEEVKALSKRAGAGQLKLNEILGGSFTISNLGAYAVDQFDAIINPPQCAILAVGAIKPRVAVNPDGAVCVAKLLRATLSIDHRAIDGMAGAAFLATLRQALEQPQGIFAGGPG